MGTTLACGQHIFRKGSTGRQLLLTQVCTGMELPLALELHDFKIKLARLTQKDLNGPMHYGQNFEKSLNRKTYYHSIEEHPKIRKIPKFGCETL